ncbi:MAG: hypothetical protein EXR74_09685 [Bdellovibrionales bacterium]|nr:hypothetical protein [Bdellovibrionales bacterium]
MNFLNWSLYSTFKFSVFIALCLSVNPIFSHEVDSFEIIPQSSRSPIESLLVFSDKLNPFLQQKLSTRDLLSTSPVSSIGKFTSTPSYLKLPSDEERKNSSFPGLEIKANAGFGNLPLPIAEVAGIKKFNNSLQSQIKETLGGSPYGAYAGKTSFGNTEPDSSFQDFIDNDGNPSYPSNLPDNDWTIDDSKIERTQEQIIKEETESKIVKEQMDKLTLKLSPFANIDYRTYEQAKLLFKDNHKIINRMPGFEEGFVKNAKELFVAHSWRDQDKKGKKPFEKFIEQQEPKLAFPYPKGQEPTPTIHQGKRSH